MGPPPPQAEGEKRKDTGGGSDGEAMAIGSIDAGMGAVGGFDGKELGFSKGSGVEVSKGIDLVSHEVDSSVGLGVCLAQVECTVLIAEPEKESSAKKISYSNAICDDLDEAVKPVFVVKEGIADVSIPEDLTEDVDPLWKCFVVGYFMNDAPHIGIIHSTVNRIWGSPGKGSKIDVQFIGKRTVLFRVEDAQVRSRIIKRKFWHVSEVPLVLNEWTPESAKAPPDLSAMPQWVDLENVPGYLYSKKGLTFLSRTAGKFVKLHPTTERCVRLDVARVLVEVDLRKPLPQKICFKEKDGNEVTVGVKFPWLPPCCKVCSKWGHNEKDCHVECEVVILKKPQAEEQHITVTEGAKEVISGSSRAVVTELLTELENLSVKATLDGDVSNTWKDLRLFLNNLSSSTESEKWVTLGDQDHRQTSPPREKQAPVEVTSPNSFELLQYIREEGEIDEDEELLGEEAPKQQNEEGVDVLDEGTNGDDKVGRKKTGQGAGQRGKGR